MVHLLPIYVSQVAVAQVVYLALAAVADDVTEAVAEDSALAVAEVVRRRKEAPLVLMPGKAAAADLPEVVKRGVPD